MDSYYVSLTGIGESEVVKEDVDVENLEDDEAIIKAEYSMISAGTELSRAFAIKKGFEYPVRPGYCMVGTILAKGKKIEAEVGDKVFAGCAHASVSRFKHTTKTQGGFIFKLPEGINLKEATSINLCLIAIQGVNLTEVKLNDTVAIFGLGNIGILAGLMYQKLGCRVIGLDPVKERCNLAKEMGIKITVDDKDQLDAVTKLTNGKGADIAVDATGISPAIITAINSCKRYGQVLLLGSARQGYECDITPVFNKIHMMDLKVIGALNNTCPVENAEGRDDSVHKNMLTVCNMIMNKDIDVSKLITKVIDPKDCKQAYYDLMYNKDKVNCIVYDWRNY